MNSLIKIFNSVFLITSLFFLVCCNQEPTESTTGTISVLVVDNDSEETPVADVEITITPGNNTKKTNADGMTSFEVNASDYFVDAEVCCAGPGNIEYHVPVKVIENKTADVELLACLLCN